MVSSCGGGSEQEGYTNVEARGHLQYRLGHRDNARLHHRENKAYATLVTKETIATAMKTNSWLRPNLYALFSL